MLFLFDDFSLDRSRRELKRGENPIAVQPQVFDLLIYLVENRDRVVSRDDLIDAVWNGRIVSESTLASRINAARQALGDSGKAQSLIRTYARKGFRFVGEVVNAGKAEDAQGKPPAVFPPSVLPSQVSGMQSRMSESELSALIGDIYDAALDPSLWIDALERSSRFVTAHAAAFHSLDLTSQAANVQYVFGIEPEFARSYVETYARIDPMRAARFFFGVGEVAARSDMVPYDEFLESRFFREWTAPQGWIDSAMVLLEKSATGLAAFTVLRKDGLADDTLRHRMSLLAPHIRRAVLIGKTIELKKAEADTLADTLDTLAAGLFLVNPVGRLVHANTRGHAMLAEESILRAAGGRLVANDLGVDQALRSAFSAAEGGDGVLGTQAIAVPLAADGQHFVAHVLPLTSGARRSAGRSYAAAAAVFVRRAEIDTPAAPEVIARLYELTPSELRVLLAVFESGGVPDVAEALGISEATAKTHLRRLFEKTGTRRQADLVKLVAGFAGPGR